MNNLFDYTPCHIWGDAWPYWNELYQAEDYIQKYVYRYSRCRLSSKEKYGTIRYEFVTPPRWTWYIWNCWLYFKWVRIGNWVLKRAVVRAAKKFPNVKNEILDDFTWCSG